MMESDTAKKIDRDLEDVSGGVAPNQGGPGDEQDVPRGANPMHNADATADSATEA